MAAFWRLMEQSTITSGILAVMLCGVASYCVIVGQDIPDFFAMGLGTVLGYFFSEKVRDARARRVQ